MESKVTEARYIALKILKEVNQDDKYANISLKENLRGQNLSDLDQAFVTQLVYGTLEKQLTIDYYLGKFASMKRVNPWIMNILRLGVYQILYLDRVPDSAACNEAVKLCKRYGLFALQGFVNGTLRNISRSKEKLVLPDKSLTPVKNLSLMYGYPEWLVEKWIKDYGMEMAEDILKPPSGEDAVSIRCNTLKLSPAELKDRLEQSGVTVTAGIHLKEALRLKNAGDIEENTLFREGCFMVQGEGSMLTAHVVDPNPGEKILDACSSPGGKAIHMTELMQDRGSVIAWDVHQHRVELIKKNVRRMGVKSLRAELGDASVLNADLIGKFDRILIDAPCSGLGIIHKKPDIKLKIKKNDLKELHKLQTAILKTCGQYLKPGGVLVYSTCTINKDENEAIVKRLLADNENFYLDDIEPYVPDSLKSAISGSMVQLIPSRNNTDGFFIARLGRRE